MRHALELAKTELIEADRNGHFIDSEKMETINTALGAYEYIYCKNIGNGVFTIARLPKGDCLFIWLDKYGTYNVFEEFEEYLKYNGGDLECQRVCFDDVYLEETDEGYQEGVDALDRYMASLVEKLS